MVVANGKILSSIPLRRKLKNGNTSVAYFNESDEIDNYNGQVAEKLGPDGPINIQLRLTTNGPMVFEINPRFSGTTPVRSSFGVNEVSILVEYLEKGNSLTDKPVLKEGMVIRYTVDQFVSTNDLKRLKIYESIKGGRSEYLRASLNQNLRRPGNRASTWPHFLGLHIGELT